MQQHWLRRDLSLASEPEPAHRSKKYSTDACLHRAPYWTINSDQKCVVAREVGAK